MSNKVFRAKVRSFFEHAFYVAHLENCWMDVYEIWYKYYASVSHSILVLLNSVQL
jgi:hypothetical protein